MRNPLLKQGGAYSGLKNIVTNAFFFALVCFRLSCFREIKTFPQLSVTQHAAVVALRAETLSLSKKNCGALATRTGRGNQLNDFFARHVKHMQRPRPCDVCMVREYYPRWVGVTPGCL